MKKNPIIIILCWIIWGVGMNYFSEYVFSRPMNGTIQFLSTLFILTMTVLLVRKTYLYIINTLNK